MTALLVVGIFVLGFILAREANALGVAAVGRLLGAPVMRENVYRNFSLTTVDLTYETHSMTRLLALYAGGMLGVAAWIITLVIIAMLVATGYLGVSTSMVPEYASALLQHCLQLCNEAIGLPFLPHYWGNGLLVPEGALMTNFLVGGDPVLISLIWLSRVTAIYMGVTALPVIIGISAYTDVVRRWLITLGGEGLATIYVGISTSVSWLAAAIIVIVELKAFNPYM